MNRRDPLAGLHVFRQVADTGSFTRAAALLGVTPAAVSQAINQLEAELRLSCSTAPPAGQPERGRAALPRTDRTALPRPGARREALGESLAEPSGQLRISALHLAKNLVIAPMLNEFVRRYPKVQLEIRYEDQLVDIVRERLDAGIRLADAPAAGHGRGATDSAARVPAGGHSGLPRRARYAGQRRRPRWACRRALPFRAAAACKWRLREDGRELEVDLPARFVSTDTETIIEAARAGAGIAQAFIRERVAADPPPGAWWKCCLAVACRCRRCGCIT